MELTRANLLKKFPKAEICAGSFLVVVDGVKEEVATMHPSTGEYKLTDVGSKVFNEEDVVVEPKAPAKSGGKAKKGLAPAKEEPAPVESLTLPGVEEAPEVEDSDPFGLEALEASLVDAKEVEADE